MTKRSKSPAPPVPSPDNPTDIANLIFVEALNGIRAAVQHAANHPDNPELASLLGTLAQKVSAVAAEHRKAEAAERKRIATLAYADVMAFIRQLSPDRRAHLLREARQIDAQGSVLA